MDDLRKVEFVVFDVETTGLSPANGDRMIEIAAIKIRDFKPATKFYSLIDPERPISSGAFAVNGISREMLVGAPAAQEVLPHFLEYVKGAVILGYNAKFDMGFLVSETARFGQRVERDQVVLDVLKMARGLLPSLGQYPLWYVARHLGLEQKQEHRALADVILTWEIFKRLMDVAQRRDMDNLESLINTFAYQRGNNFQRIGVLH